MSNAKILFKKSMKQARERSATPLSSRYQSPQEIARLAYDTSRIEGIKVSKSRLVEVARRSKP